jgi:hypothetical protein
MIEKELTGYILQTKDNHRRKYWHKRQQRWQQARHEMDPYFQEYLAQAAKEKQQKRGL